MGAKQVLELEIKTTTSGDGVTKVEVGLGKVQGGLSDFEKALSGARSTVGGLDRDMMLFGKNIGSAADALSAFGINIPTTPMALFGQAARGVVDVLGESVQMAGDAAEMVSRFNVTFGDSAAEVEDILAGYGDEVGRSTVQLQDMAAGIQTILTPMGMARDEASGWSVEMAQLATDLGAFFNVADADALRDIRSGLMGSTEVMEKYGVNLKMAALNQELLNMGIEGGVSEASELEKMYARLNIIMTQTGDIQGQAGREAESFNGQMKALNAEMDDLKVSLGEAVLPAVLQLVSAFNNGNRTIDVSRRFWDALEGALDAGVITQEEFNEAGREYQDVAREGNAVTEETIAWIEELEASVQKAAFAQAGYGDLTAEQVSELQDYGMELDGVRDDLDGVSESTQDLIDVEAAYSESMSDLHTLMNGQMGPALESFNDKQADLKTKMGEVRAEIAELESRWYLTPDQKQQLEDLQTEFGDLQDESGELTDQFEEDSKRRQFALLEEQAIAAGVYDAEFFEKLADQWGIADEETGNYQASAAVFWAQIKEDADITLSDLQELEILISTLPEEWSGQIIYDIVMNGQLPTPGGTGVVNTGGTGDVGSGGNTQIRAEGGPVVPGQRYIVGEQGPEMFVADQPGQIVSNRDLSEGGGAGGGITINFHGPAYFRTEDETRALIERVLTSVG